MAGDHDVAPVDQRRGNDVGLSADQRDSVEAARAQVVLDRARREGVDVGVQADREVGRACDARAVHVAVEADVGGRGDRAAGFILDKARDRRICDVQEVRGGLRPGAHKNLARRGREPTGRGGRVHLVEARREVGDRVVAGGVGACRAAA